MYRLLLTIIIAYALPSPYNCAAQGFAQPNQKSTSRGNNSAARSAADNKPKPKPVPRDVWGIDTFINPPSVVTQLAHDEVRSALFRIDLLDGEIDSTVANFRTNEQDQKITTQIYKLAHAAQAYFENETFDHSPTLNVNIKKKYLNTLAKELNYFANNAYRKDFDFDANIDIVDKLLNMANAQKQNRLEPYILANVTESTYKLLPYFSNDSDLRLKFLNKVSVRLPHLLDNLTVLELSKLDGFCNNMAMWAKTKPNKILTYSTSTGAEAAAVRNCTAPELQPIFRLGDSAKNPLRAIAFLADYSSGKKSIESIDKICSDDYKYYAALCSLRLAKQSVAQNVIDRDLAIFAKDYVRTINELHDASDGVRFKCVDNFTPEELYYLCVLGSDDIYTSSYLGIYKRLMQRLGNRKGNVFLEQVGYDKFRGFVRMCANYNTLDDFLGSMSDTASKDLMRRFVANLGTGNDLDLEGAVNIADCIGSIKSKSQLQFLQQQINENAALCASNGSKKAARAYAILQSLFTSNDSNSTFTNTYKMPPINRVQLNTLQAQDSTATVYEQMFFYGDEDGKVGYRSFIGTFDRTRWTVDESAQYWTVIKTKGQKVPIVIYANKALTEPQDEVAQAALAQYLNAQNIKPRIIVHRGHSYHLDHTIKAMNYDHKIIILGSCGGYHNLQEILTRSPDAHIVSTKQVGAFAVNTPIINSVHNAIMSGNDVAWDKIWNKLEESFAGNPRQKELFNDYVPPHKNLGALFLKAYNSFN